MSTRAPPRCARTARSSDTDALVYAVRSGIDLAAAERQRLAMKPLAEQLVDEIAKLVPAFLQDPIDGEQSKGNAVVLVIDGEGRTFGRIFGTDRDKGRWCYGIASRKVAQVWRTGYATGEFEKLVYEGRLDEGSFGVNRPDFIGWQGGVPLEGPDRALIAAAFSGFRGIKDIEIIEKASASVPGLRVRRHSP
jgi:hypothetical protein